MTQGPTDGSKQPTSGAQSSPRRRNGHARVFVGALLALVLVSGAAVWAVLYSPASDIAPGQRVWVTIEPGSTDAEIGKALAAAGVVRNANMFQVQVKLAHAEGRLRSGMFQMGTGLPYEVAIDTLLSGSMASYVDVTIPEGFVIEQIAERMEAEADVSAQEFVALAKSGADRFVEAHPALAGAYGGSLEGYLFPKTYRVEVGAEPNDVIEMMLDQFDSEITAIDLTQAGIRGMDRADVVTLASMIEREARIAKERPLVSSVVYNRLEAGMNLEIDATIEYVLPGNRLRLNAEQISIESPYNTYKYPGLPPGPIANPGIESLKAAAAPAETDYLYYVLTAKDGSHTFAATKEEFLAAKAKSKEVFGE